MLEQLNEKNFEEKTKNGIKFVAFTADWCGYCKRQKPILKEIAENDIWIGEINGDEYPNIVHKFNINGFPAFLLFKEGKLIAKFEGYRDKYSLLNTLLDYLK